MKSFTLNFWPGLLLWVLIRLGAGIGICVVALCLESNFSSGTAYGLGLAMLFNGLRKMYIESRIG